MSENNQNTLKKFQPILPALGLLAILIIGFFVSNSSSNLNNTSSLSSSDLDRQIREFILENPEVLIESVEKYRVAQQQEQFKREEEANQKAIQSNLKNYKVVNAVGNQNGSKIVYEFLDYNCGYCKKFHTAMNEVIAKDKDIKLAIIQMPVLGNKSLEYAKLALAVTQYDLYEEYHNYMFDTRKGNPTSDEILTAMNIPSDTKQSILSLVNENDQSIVDQLETDRALSQAFKFTGTPAAVINEQVLRGYVDANALESIIKEQF
jgi:protein-disulfide isomerase